jgi:uncharacterized protein (TIGR02145 family)/uncharacterized repeat protein (TIGR02543 family)
MRKIFFATFFLLASSCSFLAGCNGKDSQSTAPESGAWNAAFRVEAGSLTSTQLASATWVRVEASRDGAVLVAKEAAYDVGSVTLRIPSPGDVEISLTGFRDSTKSLVMWTGAGTVGNGVSSPGLGEVTLSAGAGLSHASTLSSLSVTSGALVPDFDAATMSYVDTVGSAVDHVTVSGATTDPLGTVLYSVGGGTLGPTNRFSLASGAVTVVTVRSTNVGGISSTYTVSVYRKASSGASKPRYALSTMATHGSISLNPSGGTYDSGASVTATATPDSGYAFNGWSGACSNSSGTCTVKMTSAKSLTASFTASGTASDTGVPWNSKISFGTFTDGRDGQVYKTVVIGGNMWMAQNLNYAGRTSTVGVCYGNSNDSCGKYGRLYTWADVMDAAHAFDTAMLQASLPRQGICPDGWHVPSDAEWTNLTDTTLSSTTAGTVLKSASGWSRGNGTDNGWSSMNGTDSLGFRVLPVRYFYNSSYYDDPRRGSFWTASEVNATRAWCRYFNAGYASVARLSTYSKGIEFSLRCVQNRL